MGELRCLSKFGDTPIIWDPEDEEEVNIAKTKFNTLLKEGFTAYKVAKDGGMGKKIKRFTPTAGKIIMVPELVGG